MAIATDDFEVVSTPAYDPNDFEVVSQPDNDFEVVSPKKLSLLKQQAALRRAGRMDAFLTKAIDAASYVVEPFTASGMLNQPSRLVGQPDAFHPGTPVVNLPEFDENNPAFIAFLTGVLKRPPTKTEASIAAGSEQLVAQTLSGFTTPENIATLPAAAESALVRALFGAQMAHDLPEQVQHGAQVTGDIESTPAEKIVAVGAPAISSAMIAGLSAHTPAGKDAKIIIDPKTGRPFDLQNDFEVVGKFSPEEVAARAKRVMTDQPAPIINQETGATTFEKPTELKPPSSTEQKLDTILAALESGKKPSEILSADRPTPGDLENLQAILRGESPESARLKPTVAQPNAGAQATAGVSPDNQRPASPAPLSGAVPVDNAAKTATVATAAPETITVRTAPGFRSTDERKGSAMTADSSESPERVAATPSSSRRTARKSPGLTEEDGLLFHIANSQKIPAFMPDGIVAAQYRRLKRKFDNGKGFLSPKERAQWNRIRPLFPAGYEDDFGVNGESMRRAYKAAQRAGVAGEIFRKVKQGESASLDEQLETMRRDTGRDISPNELWDEIERLSNAHAERHSGKEDALIAQMEKQHVDFHRDNSRPSKDTENLLPDNLSVGDQYTLNGARLRVSDIQFDDAGQLQSIELDDGNKYGTQRIYMDDGSERHALRLDKGSFKQKPVDPNLYERLDGSRLREEVGGRDQRNGRELFEPDSDFFNTIESFEEQKARLKREAQEKAAKDKAQAQRDFVQRGGDRLTGQDLDTTQEMFGAEVKVDKSGQGSLFEPVNESNEAAPSSQKSSPPSGQLAEAVKRRREIIEESKGDIYPFKTPDEFAQAYMQDTLALPDGWELNDTIPSKYGYWQLTDPSGQKWKVSVRDHESSPFRNNEFGGSDVEIFVKNVNDPEDFAEGMTRLEQRLGSVAKEKTNQGEKSVSGDSQADVRGSGQTKIGDNIEADSPNPVKPSLAEDYRDAHQAPMRDSGAPLHDLTNTYPADFYGPNGARYYGHGEDSVVVNPKILKSFNPSRGENAAQEPASRSKQPREASPQLARDVIARGGTVRGVLKAIAGSKSVFSPLAEALLANADAHSLGIKVDGTAQGNKSYWQPSTHDGGERIRFVPGATLDAFRIMHEVLHPLTATKLKNSAAMKALFEQAKTLAGGNHYGFKKVEEFVAEAFSNPDFMRQLDRVTVPRENVTLWQKFVATMRKALGLKPGMESLLDQVLREGAKVVSSQRENGQEVAPGEDVLHEPQSGGDIFKNSPQRQAVVDEYNALEKDFREGKLTPQEFDSRAVPLRNKIRSLPRERLGIANRKKRSQPSDSGSNAELNEPSQKTQKSPIRWVGGKRQFMPVLQKLFAPFRNLRLVEPFFGSGTVTLGLRPKSALVNDLNPVLANFHQRVAQGMEYDLPYKSNARDFANARERYNGLLSAGKQKTSEAAKLFYYLNQTGHGGLYRTNGKGEFNVGFQHDKDGKPIRPLSDYRESYANTEIKNGGYEDLQIRKGDFLYSDPPYDSEFSGYGNKGGFGWGDQVKHAEWLAIQNVPTVTQNEATPRILALYKKLGFDVFEIPARRSISRDGEGRAADQNREMIATRNMDRNHVEASLKDTGAKDEEGILHEPFSDDSKQSDWRDLQKDVEDAREDLRQAVKTHKRDIKAKAASKYRIAKDALRANDGYIEHLLLEHQKATGLEAESLMGELSQLNKKQVNRIYSDLQKRGLLPENKPTRNDDSGRTLDKITNWLRENKSDSPNRSFLQRLNLGERAAQRFNEAKDAAGKALATAQGDWNTLVDLYKNPGKPDTDFRKIMKSWIYADQRTGLETRRFVQELNKQIENPIRRQALSVWLDAKGDDSLIRMQATEVPSRFEKVWKAALTLTPNEKALALKIKADFKAKLDDAVSEGLVQKGRAEYGVPQRWKTPPETPVKSFAESDGKKGSPNNPNAKLDPRDPFFAFQRTHDSYFDGIMAKGIPASLDIGHLVADYDASFHKALSSRGAIAALRHAVAADGLPVVKISGSAVKVGGGETGATFVDSGKINKSDVSADGRAYQPINHFALKDWVVRSKDTDGSPIIVKGDFLVHPDYYEFLKNELQGSALRQGAVGKLVRPVLASNAFMKASKLAFAGFHLATIGEHMASHLANPFIGKFKIDMAQPDQKLLVRNGLELGMGAQRVAYEEGLSAHGGLFSKIPLLGDWSAKLTDWMFKDYIPTIMMKVGVHTLKDYRKRYAKEVSAGKITEEILAQKVAEQLNAGGGLLNYRLMGRSKAVMDLSRLALLAPQFLEARARVVSQAFQPYGHTQRKMLITQAIGLYVGARILNTLFNDDRDPHWEVENMFNFVHNGRAYSIRAILGDVVHAFTDPKSFVSGRLSPLTKIGYETITQRDLRTGARKEPLFQTENEVSRVAQNFLADLANWFVPIGVDGIAPGHNARGQSPTRAVMQSFGVGSRRYTAQTKIAELARHFNRDSDDPAANNYQLHKDGASYGESDYRQIDNLLEAEDYKAAAKEYRILLNEGKTEKAIAQRYLDLDRPFTGKKTREALFKNSLTPNQKITYREAIDERKKKLGDYRKMRAIYMRKSIE